MGRREAPGLNDCLEIKVFPIQNYRSDRLGELPNCRRNASSNQHLSKINKTEQTDDQNFISATNYSIKTIQNNEAIQKI